MKSTEPYIYEMAYDCPYCHNTQGWSNEGYEEEDYKEPRICNHCRKEFMLEKAKGDF